ncbi:hypothetical protein OF83DRAFT_1178683 [Amylostereum chailletii]|nr:hypothetical protein OF83DRAFT_1178683 [Amylostereum chailletii]
MDVHALPKMHTTHTTRTPSTHQCCALNAPASILSARSQCSRVHALDAHAYNAHALSTHAHPQPDPSPAIDMPTPVPWSLPRMPPQYSPAHALDVHLHPRPHPRPILDLDLDSPASMHSTNCPPLL